MKKIDVVNGEITAPAFPMKAVLSNDNRSSFSFEENNKVYCAKNTNKLVGCCLKIDDGLYTQQDNTQKCDYGFLLENGKFFLIELKGKNLPKAYDQLLNTLKLLKRDYSDFVFDYHCRIVAKEGLPKANTQRQKFEVKLRHYTKNKYLVSENRLEESVF